MKAYVQLMQDGGVRGPRQEIDVPENDLAQDAAARAWAKAQTGHPWDSLVIEYQSALDWVCRSVEQF